MSNATNKRKEGSRSSTDELSETESVIALMEPPFKKRRLNGSNHNRSSNDSDRWTAARNSSHYRNYSKFKRYLNQVTPYNTVNFQRLMDNRDSEDDSDNDDAECCHRDPSIPSRSQLMELKEVKTKKSIPSDSMLVSVQACDCPSFARHEQ